jgi:hypothetical protein
MNTGSLVNNIMAQSQEPEVVEGMGATMLMYTDRKPFTIIEVVNQKEIRLQADNYVRTDNNGMSDSQNYEYSPNPLGTIYTATKRKNGHWVTKGHTTKSGTYWGIGHRSAYYDFSF